MMDQKLLEQYPYLDITEADLAQLVEDDSYCRQCQLKIKEHEAGVDRNMKSALEHQQLVDALLLKRGELEAELRSVDSQLRSERGAVVSYKYQAKLAERRINERADAIARRHKQLFQIEVRRRLAKMGKELKLSRGIRAAKELATVISDIKT